jgi:peptide-methionine (S)-S-oxide reductase
VKNVRVGYTGGESDFPTYSAVCAGGTGHTEGYYVAYDAGTTSFDALLEQFWSEHQPTYETKAQYKSAIWAQTPEQYEKALASKEAREKQVQRKFFTDIYPPEVSLATPWWDAEEYHQKYYNKPRVSRFGW